MAELKVVSNATCCFLACKWFESYHTNQFAAVDPSYLSHGGTVVPCRKQP